MNEEPLHLIPERFRDDVAAKLNAGRGEDDFKVRIRGELARSAGSCTADG